MKKYLWLIPIIVGLGICIYSALVIPGKIEKEKTYVETTAVVVDYEMCTFDDGTTGNSYIAEYQVDRDKYRIKSSSCATINKSIGSEVKVKYNPKDPSIAVFTNDISNYIIPLIGVIFVICGVVIKRKQ